MSGPANPCMTCLNTGRNPSFDGFVYCYCIHGQALQKQHAEKKRRFEQ